MARHQKHKEDKMATTYVKAVEAGAAPREAANIAGYSRTFPVSEIERPGGPVDRKFEEMRLALKEKGIDDKWLAGQYAKGADMATSGQEYEAMAHAKYLLQIGYLLGHGVKNGTTVAVQVNNGVQGSSQFDDPARARELVGEVTQLIEVLKTELGARVPNRFHAGNTGTPGGPAQAHPGVGQTQPDSREPAGGGGA